MNPQRHNRSELIALKFTATNNLIHVQDTFHYANKLTLNNNLLYHNKLVEEIYKIILLLCLTICFIPISDGYYGADNVSANIGE